MKEPKYSKKLDELLSEGFRESTIDIAKNCILLEKNEERVIYDKQRDYIITKYKVNMYKGRKKYEI